MARISLLSIRLESGVLGGLGKVPPGLGRVLLVLRLV